LNAGHRREDIDRLVEVLRLNQHIAAPRRFVAAGSNWAAAPQPAPTP
jgi:hypothetical protein